MTHMKDVFGDNWVNKFIVAETHKRITLRRHRDFSTLMIANYTPATAYENAWDEVTLASRGLIFDSDSGEVLARPLTKFFNYGQTGAPKIPLDAEVTVANKYDGSLGIVYRRPDGMAAVATRGSFHSEQAEHATAVLWADADNDLYWYDEELEDGWTPLVEIIYPENRIVLDYGQKDYLQYLGSVLNSTGAFLPNDVDDDTIVTTFREVLERKPRVNAEGYVVWLDRHTAVKIKQEDYVALHAVVTNLSEKAVWGVVKGESVHEWVKFVSALPDELQQWAEDIREALLLKVWDEERLIYREFELVNEVAWGYTDQDAQLIPRKTFAQAVQDTARPEYRPYMFSILDGRSIIDKLFDKHKPVGLGARPAGSVAAEAG